MTARRRVEPLQSGRSRRNGHWGTNPSPVARYFQLAGTRTEVVNDRGAVPVIRWRDAPRCAVAVLRAIPSLMRIVYVYFFYDICTLRSGPYELICTNRTLRPLRLRRGAWL